METMGQKLRTAREKKRMNLSRAAALTHIKVQHLEMMEGDDFSKMPAPTYAKGFIRIYSGLLGLDPEPLVQEYIDVHLNAGSGETPAAARTKRREAGAPEGEGKTVAGEWPDKIKAFIGEMRKKFDNFSPHLPRVGLALLAAFLVVGIVRCAVRLGSGGGGAPEPALLDGKAIMKEPPVRYLDLPSSGEEQP